MYAMSVYSDQFLSSIIYSVMLCTGLEERTCCGGVRGNRVPYNPGECWGSKICCTKGAFFIYTSVNSIL